jgi:hypothetical protein
MREWGGLIEDKFGKSQQKKKKSKKNKDEKSIDSLYRSMMMRFYGPPSRSLSFPLFKESSRNKTEYMKALQRRCEAFFSIFPNNLTFFFLFFLHISSDTLT